MESSIKKIQLLFCHTCGLQRVCDVTEELQKLFTEKHLEPNTCGICQKQLEPNNEQQFGIKDEQIDDSDGQNKDYDLRSNLRVVVKKDKIDTNNEEQDDGDDTTMESDEPGEDIDEEVHKLMQMGEDPELVASELVASSTAMKNELNEDIDEEVHRLMQMEEDPELVASSVLLKEADENCVKFLDPELVEATLPSDDPNRPLKCKVCNATFITIGSFVKHASDHTDKGPMEKPLKCSDCGKNYSTRAFQQHRRNHLKLKTPQQCTYKGCKFAFNERHVFQSHVEVHKGLKRHCCKVCGAGYLTKRDLSVHERVHSKGSKQFICRYCKEPFATSFKVKRHERENHDHQDTLECDECALTFSSEYLVKRHKEFHKTELKTDFVCNKCRQCFTDQSTLDQHAELNTCNAPDDIDWEEVTKFVNPRLVVLMDKPRIRSKPFRCKQCPTKEFNVASLFLNHMKYKHPKIDCPVTHAYTCDQCDVKFKWYNTVVNHNLTHSLYRPYICDHDGCNKGFKNPQQLRSHKVTHRGNRQKHICHICGAGLVSNTKLRRHMETVHSKSRPKPYKCTYCNKSFLDKWRQNHHERLSHLNERPFVCEVCGKAFKENSALVTHNYSHTGERPFACHLCEYRCIRRDYLTNHIRTHTGVHPYKCELCETTFMHKPALNYHVKKVH
ncbi:uncharacterized protein [Amphiura filiformis]|uniref:uncharacterized protein n=1 Tax=Amphiura filiformis TaxID=82378 RepID=UPI003B214570